MSQFKVGDRVVIGDIPSHWWFKRGWVGRVSTCGRRGSYPYGITFDRPGTEGLEGWVAASQAALFGVPEGPDTTDHAGYYSAVTEHSPPPEEPQG